MPQIKVIQQVTQNLVGFTTGITTTPIPLDGAQWVSSISNVTVPVGPASGTLVMQFSNDATDTIPTNWSNNGNPITLNGGFSWPIERLAPSANWVRLKFTVASGTFSSLNTIITKGPN